MKPNVLVVGKTDSIVQWLEDTRDGFEDAGATARIFALNGNSALGSMRVRLIKRTHGQAGVERYLVQQLERSLTASRPQLVVFVQAYWAPAALMAAVKAAGIASAGWVGDRFDARALNHALDLDSVYYTDSGFLSEAEQFGFPRNGQYLPHAANARLFHPAPAPRASKEQIAFVAVPTQHRLALLRQVETPIAVYGRRWSAIGPTRHEVHNHWLARKKLPRLYQESLAVLNVRNELNVLEGLNQRSFEPAACGTPVIHDALGDLERCFEPGKEVLVFRDALELAELCEQLHKDTGLARQVGAAALARVQAQHTCAHRARTILHDFGLEQ